MQHRCHGGTTNPDDRTTNPNVHITYANVHITYANDPDPKFRLCRDDNAVEY